MNVIGRIISKILILIETRLTQTARMHRLICTFAVRVGIKSCDEALLSSIYLLIAKCIIEG